MKQEVKPGIVIAIVAVLVLGVAAYFIFGGGGQPDVIDIKKIDPKILRDDPPPRRGEPGYRERTTDPASN